MLMSPTNLRPVRGKLGSSSSVEKVKPLGRSLRIVRLRSCRQEVEGGHQYLGYSVVLRSRSTKPRTLSPMAARLSQVVRKSAEILSSISTYARARGARGAKEVMDTDLLASQQNGGAPLEDHLRGPLHDQPVLPARHLVYRGLHQRELDHRPRT